MDTRELALAMLQPSLAQSEGRLRCLGRVLPEGRADHPAHSRRHYCARSARQEGHVDLVARFALARPTCVAIGMRSQLVIVAGWTVGKQRGRLTGKSASASMVPRVAVMAASGLAWRTILGHLERLPNAGHA